MVVTRADLLDYLQKDLHKSALLVDMVETDTLDGYENALDQTFEQLGYNHADSLTVELDPKLLGPARALARFYGLETIYNNMADMVDTSIDAPNASRKDSQIPAHIGKLLDRAEAKCAFYHFEVKRAAGGVIEMGSLDLDVLSGYPTRYGDY